MIASGKVLAGGFAMKFRRLLTVPFSVLSLGTLLVAAPAVAQKPERWTLTIVHANDVHSRLQAVNKFDSTCTDKEKSEGQCLGGMARLATKAQEIDRKSTRLNSSHERLSRMPSSA